LVDGAIFPFSPAPLPPPPFLTAPLPFPFPFASGCVFFAAGFFAALFPFAADFFAVPGDFFLDLLDETIDERGTSSES